MGGRAGEQWALAHLSRGLPTARNTPSPLLLLFQAQKGAIQVLAVLCVLGEEQRSQDRQEEGDLCLPTLAPTLRRCCSSSVDFSSSCFSSSEHCFLYCRICQCAGSGVSPGVRAERSTVRAGMGVGSPDLSLQPLH